MEKTTRFAFDLGGVIFERKGENFVLIKQSFISVKMTIQKFGAQNVFIVSKAKPKYQQKNIDFLKNQNFFTQTGFLTYNVHFVYERQQKGPFGKQLELTYILDDRIIAVDVAKKAGFTCILFGQHQQFMKKNENVINVKGWKKFREILEKLN